MCSCKRKFINTFIPRPRLNLQFLGINKQYKKYRKSQNLRHIIFHRKDKLQYKANDSTAQHIKVQFDIS